MEEFFREDHIANSIPGRRYTAAGWTAKALALWFCLGLQAVAPEAHAGSYRNPDYLFPATAPAPPSRSSTFTIEVLSLASSTDMTTTRVVSLDDVLVVGLSVSRQMKILLDQLESSLHTYRAVKSGFHPAVSATTRTDDSRLFSITQRLSSDGTLTLNHLVPAKGPASSFATLSQALNVLSDPDLRQGGLTWVISQLDYLEGVEDYKFSVIQKFYEVLLNQELLRSQEDSIGRTRTLVEIAEAKFELGLSSKLDLLNTQVNLGRARTATIQQRARLQKSVDELRDLIGIQPLIPIQVSQDLKFDPIDPVMTEGFRRDLESQRVKVRLFLSREGEARQRGRPSFNLDVDYKDNVAEEVVAGLRYSFAVGGRPEDDRFRAAHANTQVEQTRLSDLWYKVRREKRDILRVLEAQAESVKVALTNQDNAEESYEFSRLAFEKGLINNLDLRVAQDNLTQARNAYVSTLIDYMTRTYQYVRVFGGTL